jgi:hypothetical protein
MPTNPLVTVYKEDTTCHNAGLYVLTLSCSTRSVALRQILKTGAKAIFRDEIWRIEIDSISSGNGWTTYEDSVTIVDFRLLRWTNNPKPELGEVRFINQDPPIINLDTFDEAAYWKRQADEAIAQPAMETLKVDPDYTFGVTQDGKQIVFFAALSEATAETLVNKAKAGAVPEHLEKIWCNGKLLFDINNFKKLQAEEKARILKEERERIAREQRLRRKAEERERLRLQAIETRRLDELEQQRRQQEKLEQEKATSLNPLYEKTRMLLLEDDE